TSPGRAPARGGGGESPSSVWPSTIFPAMSEEAAPWDARRAWAIIRLLNYLTSEPHGPIMSSRSKKSGPDASGILADLWRLMQSVMDDSEPELGALGLSPKAFFLLEAVEDH